MDNKKIYDFYKMKQQLHSNAPPKLNKELKKIVSIIRSFPKERQNIIHLSVHLQCSVEDISKMLNYDEAFVRKQLQEAVRALANTDPQKWLEALLFDIHSEEEFQAFLKSKGATYMQEMIDTDFTVDDLIQNAISYQEKEQQRKHGQQKNEIKKILRRIDRMTEKQHEILAYYFLFEYGIEEIVSEIQYEEIYVRKKIREIQRKLRGTDKTYWQDAIHTYLRKEVFEKYAQKDNKAEINTRKRIHGFRPIQNVIRRSQRYRKVAIIGLVMFALPVITVYAMNKVGIIRIPHVQSDALIAPEGEQLDIVETLYLPEYLPKGYALLEQKGILHKDPQIQTTYGLTDYVIEFFQTVSNVNIKIDNENGNFRKVKINGKEGWYQDTESMRKINWSEGNYVYSVVSYDNPNITKEELIKITESLKEKEQ